MAAAVQKCIRSLHRLHRRFHIAGAQEASVSSLAIKFQENNSAFKTGESNPGNHTLEQAGLLYTVPENESYIFQHGGLPKPFMLQCSTFNETSFMIRKQGVEIISHLKSANYENPPLKFVLYGKPGHGKSLIMAQIIRHAVISKHLIIHVPWVGDWLRRPKEVVNSKTRPGFVDIPVNAVKWLLHFKSQNQALIKELDLRLCNDYEWSKRELSKAGDSLLDIVELGLNRTRHACEIIIAILKETKGYCISNKCKALVAVDGYNAFFHSNTRVRNEERVWMPPEKVSIVPAFMDMTKNDWHNGAVVVTCDEMVVPGHDTSPLPVYQLGVEGFHHLHPFIPVHVPLMDEAEIRNIIAYYRERKWLQAAQEGDDEIVFLCGGNPYKLMSLCNPL